jgi:hypothetical protein
MNKKEIDKLIQMHCFINGSYTIDKNGYINVIGSVSIRRLLKISRLPIKFGTVTGNFNCTNNELTSLEGAPKEVGGNFACSRNNLTSLVRSPVKVGNNFSCMENYLTSLEGAPQKVGGSFICCLNKFVSFKGMPKEIGGNFECGTITRFKLEDTYEYKWYIIQKFLKNNVKYD